MCRLTFISDRAQPPRPAVAQLLPNLRLQLVPPVQVQPQGHRLLQPPGILSQDMRFVKSPIHILHSEVFMELDLSLSVLRERGRSRGS